MSLRACRVSRVSDFAFPRKVPPSRAGWRIARKSAEPLAKEPLPDPIAEDDRLVQETPADGRRPFEVGAAARGRGFVERRQSTPWRSSRSCAADRPPGRLGGRFVGEFSPAVGRVSSRWPSGRIVRLLRIAGGSDGASPCCACDRRNFSARLLSRQEIPHVSGASGTLNCRKGRSVESAGSARAVFVFSPFVIGRHAGFVVMKRPAEIGAAALGRGVRALALPVEKRSWRGLTRPASR